VKKISKYGEEGILDSFYFLLWNLAEIENQLRGEPEGLSKKSIFFFYFTPIKWCILMFHL